jgi:hypothetical protein
MFTKEFFELFVQIIKSWQVIAVSIALVLYLNIVSHAAKSYRPPKMKKVKVKQKKAEPLPLSEPEEDEGGRDSNEELGLEEA